MLANLLTALGFTRDSRIWLWGRVVSAAGIFMSGVFDLNYWATYLGFQISPTVSHWITALSVLVLWISGKQAHSELPGGQK